MEKFPSRQMKKSSSNYSYMHIIGKRVYADNIFQKNCGLKMK